MKRQTIKSLAVEIRKRWPDLLVTVERGYCNTDWKPRGYRYIVRKGKGRWGSRIIVRTKSGELLLDHNNAETYRCTSEVVEWIKSRGGKR